ncbi:hypothetical protein Bbelb_393480 [Branchiostoma belcheri]|nr:hypothetical protein Bbelb_393480 [Branchiostoma belcheri]
MAQVKFSEFRLKLSSQNCDSGGPLAPGFVNRCTNGPGKEIMLGEADYPGNELIIHGRGECQTPSVAKFLPRTPFWANGHGQELVSRSEGREPAPLSECHYSPADVTPLTSRPGGQGQEPETRPSSWCAPLVRITRVMN